MEEEILALRDKLRIKTRNCGNHHVYHLPNVLGISKSKTDICKDCHDNKQQNQLIYVNIR